MTAVARPFARCSLGLLFPHCHPNHIEKFRQLGAMQRKDTWLKVALTITVLFFFFKQGKCQSSYTQASKYTGALNLDRISTQFKGYRCAFVTHAASVNFDRATGKEVHTLDLARRAGMDVSLIFSPEHGFAASYSAGELINGEKVEGLGIPIVSLYGSHKKPTSSDLEEVDVVVFDLQDVGVRFYTYISTLTYVMEACRENDIPLVVLDRPNPFANVVDGPILEKEYSSFVGMHPVPVLYGMTIGEYALMVKGEGWIPQSDKLNLYVIPCKEYNRQEVQFSYPPSPNLQNAHAVSLYPSLCFFEATPVSIGRGTEAPFEVIGAPWMDEENFSFIPRSMPSAQNPKFRNQECHGIDLRELPFEARSGLDLRFLENAFREYQSKGLEEGSPFFDAFMSKLSGGNSIEQGFRNGLSSFEIQASWKPGIMVFKMTRAKYLLY